MQRQQASESDPLCHPETGSGLAKGDEFNASFSAGLKNNSNDSDTFLPTAVKRLQCHMMEGPEAGGESRNGWPANNNNNSSAAGEESSSAVTDPRLLPQLETRAQPLPHQLGESSERGCSGAETLAGLNLIGEVGDETNCAVYEKLIPVDSFVDSDQDVRRDSNDYGSSPFTTADLLFNKRHTAKLKPIDRVYRRGQSVEELLAAVEKLDQAVDQLCEGACVEDLPQTDLLSNDSDTASDMFSGSFSAASTSKYQRLVNCDSASVDDCKFEDKVPSISEIIDKEEQTKASLSCENKSDLLNEAVNENCQFVPSSPFTAGNMRRSFKRSFSADEESFYANTDATFVYSHRSTNNDANPPLSSRSLTDALSDAEEGNNLSLVNSVTNAVRRSIKRVKRFRNSFGKGRKSLSGEGLTSEESGERQTVPGDPPVGLAGVRSPSTTAILLPSIVASLGASSEPWMERPRETLTPRLDEGR